MILSQKNMNIFGFHTICYPQVKVLQKVIYTKSPCSTPTKIIKISKISTFFENFDFLDRFESFQDARSVFNFWIFDDFGPPIRQIRNLGVPKFRSQPG